MLVKNPKPQSRKWLKKGALFLLAAEVTCFALSYGLWYKVNTNRDTRKYLKDNYPTLLKVYYQSGEYFDSNNKQIRETDEAYWSAKSGHQ